MPSSVRCECDTYISPEDQEPADYVSSSKSEGQLVVSGEEPFLIQNDMSTAAIAEEEEGIAGPSMENSQKSSKPLFSL
ncbi:hypothetical protein NDU88_005660 [Pleurodeles waltl]|uniref:Uncharacterized protein n=1 Tax=Pleurodeles waltl TaxID=8319 RepID=A0AAV7PG29_PLEWA|nr:hypothetical protein NDU88_005660 [Pleurodeles waltl]